MELRINGNTCQIDTVDNVDHLLAQLGYQQNFVAVAINKTCVKRSEFGAHPVNAGDDIEILAPMAGG
ncbi:MAG: sulfur carrier protein ThiS [Deltaproteobacteria bacterium]|nr:sulfur carrier protein ThiS [Deltaproteobacteria bacterium]